jgi:hypothetical protein
VELAEILFLVVFVVWLPAGFLVGCLCEMARRGDEPMERACEERVRYSRQSGAVVLPTAAAQGIDPIAHMDGAPVRRRDCERAR